MSECTCHVVTDTGACLEHKPVQYVRVRCGGRLVLGLLIRCGWEGVALRGERDEGPPCKGCGGWTDPIIGRRLRVAAGETP